MLNQFSRTELIFGKQAMERLANARVAVFGIGGVGGYTVEALVRSVVGLIIAGEVIKDLTGFGEADRSNNLYHYSFGMSGYYGGI